MITIFKKSFFLSLCIFCFVFPMDKTIGQPKQANPTQANQDILTSDTLQLIEARDNFFNLMEQLEKMDDPKSSRVQVFYQLTQMAGFDLIVQQIIAAITPICGSDLTQAYNTFNQISYGKLMDSGIGGLCLGPMGNWTRSNAKHVPILLINFVMTNIKKLLDTPYKEKIPAILSFLEINLTKLIKRKKITNDSQAQFTELKKLYEFVCATKNKRQECKTLQKISLLLKKPTVHPHYTLKEIHEIAVKTLKAYSAGQLVLAADLARSVIMQQQYEEPKERAYRMLGIIATGQEKFEEACDYFKNAEKTTRQFGVTIQFLSLWGHSYSCLRLGNIKKARDYLYYLEPLKPYPYPDMCHKAQFLEALLLFAEGNIDQALTRVKKLIALKDHFWQVKEYLLLAMCHYKRENSAKALPILEKLTSFEGESATITINDQCLIRYYIANCLDKLDRQIAVKIALYEEVIKKTTDLRLKQKVFKKLGLVLRKQGHNKYAIGCFMNFYAIHYDFILKKREEEIKQNSELSKFEKVLKINSFEVAIDIKKEEIKQEIEDWIYALPKKENLLIEPNTSEPKIGHTVSKKSNSKKSKMSFEEWKNEFQKQESKQIDSKKS